MKRIGLILIIVICGSLSILSQNLESKNSATSDSKVIDTIIYSAGLEDNLLGDSPDRNVMIYLPPGYEDSPEKHYPVIYLLHGFGGDANMWFSGGWIDIKPIMDELISQNTLVPMIVVSPDSKNKYGGSFYTNSSVTGNWEDFIVEDVVQYVDSNFRTLPQKESRGITGHSMGGYGAIKLAMRHPQLFSAAYAMSPAEMVFEDVAMGTIKPYLCIAANADDFEGQPWEAQTKIAGAAAFAPNPSSLPFYGEFPVTKDDCEIIDSIWLKWLKHDPYTMIPIYKDSLLKLREIRFDCGTSDDYLYNANVHFSQALTDNGIDHVFESFDGDHTNRTAERIRTKMLPFFSKNLSKNLLSDTVVVPDTAFLHALIDEGVDINGDSLISYAEAEAVTYLNVSCNWQDTVNQITNITGIEAFVNLDTLRCSCNNFTSLDVSSNTALKSLQCGGDWAYCSASLTTLDVSKNTLLEYLDCCSSTLTSLDVSKNTLLERLDCSGSELTSLDVSGCAALKSLECYDNQLISLDVSGCAALKSLECYDNQLTSLDVSACAALKGLDCDFNQLTSLNVSGCAALKGLDCDRNVLTSLDICSNDSIENLSLRDMPTLDTVYVWATFPSGVNVYSEGSPNVVFSTECRGTGIYEYNQSGISIYPNPANKLLTIETDKPDQHSIEIISLNGQLIFRTEMDGTTKQIDMTQFSKGIYFVTLRSKEGVWTEKVVKL